MHQSERQWPFEEADSVWGPIYAQLLREWIAGGESAWLPLTGGSMRPFLPSGSRILVVRVAASQVDCGDLLVYEAGGHLICHRVLRRCFVDRGARFLTRGDHWQTTAAWMDAAQLVGKVIAIDRAGQRLPLDTPARRLHASGIALVSWLVGRGVGLARWGRQRLQARSLTADS